MVFSHLKINIKILLILAGTAILAAGIIGYFGYQTARYSIEEEAFSKLRAVRQIKKNQLIDLFGTIESQLKAARSMEVFQEANDSFYTVFQDEGRSVLTPKWREIALQYDPHLRQLMNEFGWYDIFLITNNGDVIYSVMRRADLGGNLFEGNLEKTSLAEAFKKIKDQNEQEVAFADFKPYAPSGNAPAAFMITPLKSKVSQIPGFLAIEVPMHKINHIMQERSGLGKSGETYLVGPDNLMRSESFLDSEGHSVVASFFGNVKDNGVDTEASREGLAGKTAAKIIVDYRGVSVLSAYTFVDLYGIRWALMAEVDKTEALTQVYQLQRRIILWFSGLIIAIIIFAFYFSKTLTRPLKLLTSHSIELAKHDFGEGVPFLSSGVPEAISSRQDEVGDLAKAFRHMQIQLDNSIQNLKRTTSAKERMESELNIGKEIQMSLLPLTFPAFPGNKEFDIYALLRPAREVGGDFYDFFFIDKDHFCFCIGDVSDKGVPSALFMAVTKTLIKSRATDHLSTATIATYLNNELSVDNKSSMFVTLFLCILNIYSGELTFTNAGHNPPLVKRNNGSIAVLHQLHGPVIGALSGIEYGEGKIFLKEGNKLLMYTDGVTEARNPDEKLFSEPKLRSLFQASSARAIEELTREILEEVDRFSVDCPQADDITLLIMEYNGPNEGVETLTLELTVKNQYIEIDKVNSEFNAFAKKCELSDSVRRKVNLVFDELLNNIISYAFLDEEEHHIAIRVVYGESRLVITISDDGTPFNIFERPAPQTDLQLEDRPLGGYGIHLVRSVMDDYHYLRENEKNISTLIKNLNEKDSD